MTDYIISREQHGTTNGKPLPPRCYVTGPHFGAGVYSGTQVRAEATRYSKAEAEKLIATRTWRGVRIEEVHNDD